MFRVELDGRDGLSDLIAMMAAHIDVDYETRVVLETSSRSLAFAVGALVGRIVESDKPAGVLPEIRFADAIREGEIIGSVSAETVSHPQGVEAGPLQGTEAVKYYGKCEFCEKPRRARSKTCMSPECDAKLKKKHNLAYKAKREAQSQEQSAFPPAPIAELSQQEAPASEGPLVDGPYPLIYQVASPEGQLAMTFSELVKGIQAGSVAEGTRIKALPSGKFYQVRGGMLAPLDSLQQESGPGQTGTLPAAG